MPALFDTFSVGNGQGLDPFTWSHTCNGVERALVVGVIVDNTATTISAPTYNAVALTLIDSVTVATDIKLWLYYLINPASGTNTVSVDVSASGACGAVAVSLTGIHQTNPLGVFSNRAGIDAAAANFINLVEAGSIIVECLAIDHASPTVTSNSMTIRGNQPVNNVNSGVMSTRQIKVKDNYVDGYVNTNAFWGIVTAAFNPADGPPRKPVNRSLRPALFTPGLAR